MKKRLAGALLLLFAVSGTPLSLAVVATGAGRSQHHRCCPRPHPQILVQLPPMPNPCGPGHPCCVSSDHPTLPMSLQSPPQDGTAKNFVPENRFAVTSEVATAEGPSPLPSCLQLSMILRI